MILSVGPFGYYVLDGWGGVWATQLLPTRRNPRAVLFADRWRGVTIIGGQPFVRAQRRHHGDWRGVRAGKR